MSDSAVAHLNRRGFRRHQPRRGTTVSCRLPDSGPDPGLPAHVLNLSETGLRLLARTPLETGRRLEVSLEAGGQHRPIHLTAEVVWSLAADDGRYYVGAKFHRYLSPADLAALAYL